MRARLLLAAGSVLLTLLPQRVSAQTFTLAPGSVTPPAAGPPNCGPPFSAFGDLIQGPPFFAVPTSVIRMGPPGCGLGWPGPAAGANVDGFSSGLFPIPVPVPAGAVSFLIGVSPVGTGMIGPCVPAVPGPFAPDVGSEACGQPGVTDAPADVYSTVGPGAPPMPAFAPGAMPNFRTVDGNGVVAPACAGPAGAGTGLVEPMPGGDAMDEIDAAALGAWSAGGLPTVPVYYSVDPPTAAAAGLLPGAVIVKPPGPGPIGVYTGPVALGLAVGDDIDALAVDDVDGLPLAFAPAAGDVVLFSLSPASPTVGTPNPCPGPLAGAPRAADDILTEGTLLGAPGAACILVPAENMNLWTARFCGPNPLTGAPDDNLNKLDVIFPMAPPATPTPTPTATSTPGGPTSTPTSTPVLPTPTPTPTPTPVLPTSTPTATPVLPTATPTVTATPSCAPLPVAGCRTPAVGAKAQLQYKDKSPDTKDQLQWKWSKGAVTSKAEFGTPLTTTSYQLCVYDGAPSLIFDATIPAGGLCNLAKPKPCWKDKTKGFDYKDKDLTPGGVEQLKLKEGLVAGKAQIQLKGKGAPLDDPALPFGLPVTVQLHNAESGLCWEAVYSAPATKNVAGPPVGQYKDKAD